VTDLTFRVSHGRAEPFAAVPTLSFDLAVTAPAAVVVDSIALRCQLRIEPQRRRYTPAEEERLVELFGETPRWGDTLKPFLWTHVAAVVPGFRGETVVELPVPCTYDLEVAAAKYFHALAGDDIPLLFLFSGTVFVHGESGLRVEQVPWHKEAALRLPVAVWRELMDAYFPHSGWLRLHRDTLHALARFKARRALPRWDDVMAILLGEAKDEP
jgi:hypothetical protein